MFFNIETTNILSLLIFHVTILQHSEEQEISEEKYNIDCCTRSLDETSGCGWDELHVVMIDPLRRILSLNLIILIPPLFT